MKKKNVWTIPNIISFVRIALIPIFVYLYFDTSNEYHHIYALSILLISGLSDIVDGFIARRFNLVSDLGKLLDPIADKLTQGVIIFCLLLNHSDLIPLFSVLFIKEILTLFAATILLRSGIKPISSKWFGKLSTVAIYCTMVFVLLTDYFKVSAPIYNWIYFTLILISITCMIISMFGYIKIFIKPNKTDEKFEED